MSRPGITYQEVANAAIQLQGQNDNPTVDRVRQILSTGSKSTIARYLKEWKSTSGQTTDADIPSELIAIVKGLWERIKAGAEQQIESYRQEADCTISEARQAVIQEQKRNAELQIQIRQLEDELHQKTSLLATFHQSLEEEKRSNAKFVERNDRLSQQLTDQKAETERLHQLLSHIQTSLEHYQAAIQKLREEQMLNSEKQKNSYEQEINFLKQNLAESVTEKNLIQREVDRSEAKLKLITQEADKLDEENSSLQKQLQEKIINESILRQKHDQLEQLCINIQNKAENQSNILIDLEKKLAIVSNETVSQQKFLREAQDKIHILRDEKLFLAQEKAHLEGQLKHLNKTSMATKYV